MNAKIRFRIIIFLVICLTSVVVSGRWLFLNVGEWLSESDEPQKVAIIVCLSHDIFRVERAVDLFKQGYADKILVTTGLTFESLIKNDVGHDNIIALDRTASSTYEEALYVSSFLDKMSYHSAIIISDPIHLYRVRWSFNYLLSESVTKRIFICSNPANAENFWWDHPGSRRYVLTEIIKIIYYWAVHGVLGLENDPQWAKELQFWYRHMLDQFA